MTQDINNKTQDVSTKVLMFAVLIILILISLVILRERNSDDVTPTLSKSSVINRVDIVKEFKKDPVIGKLIQDQITNNTEATFKGFENLAANEVDRSKAQSLKLYAAASLMAMDMDKGAEYYIAIANDTNNSRLTRAYAMTQITQFATGYSDPDLLKVFFPDPKVLKGMSELDIKIAVNQQIVGMFPMGIASARVAKYTLMKSKSTTTAREMYNKYMGDISSNLNALGEQEGLAHFIPSTYLNTAYFLQIAEKYGVSNEEEVRSYYDRAYKKALEYSHTNTIQFILLDYADYLLSKGENVDAEKLINEINKISFSDMLVSNLKDNLSDYTNLVSYSKGTSTLAKELKSKLSEIK